MRTQLRSGILLVVTTLISQMPRNSQATQPAEDARYLIPPGASWKYHAAAEQPPGNWTQLEFDDAAWPIGNAGFGYGDDDDKTVLESMAGAYSCVRIRRSFDISDPNAVDTLFLYVKFDDGFIAYLNGEEVARACIEEAQGGHFVRDHEAFCFEEFLIADPSRYLRSGKNVLAIEGHNRELSSSDFSLHPYLATSRVPDPNLRMMTRGQVVADLTAFKGCLEDQSSYLRRLGFDYEAAFAKIEDSLGETVSNKQLAREIEWLLAQIGDGHAWVARPFYNIDARYLPICLGDAESGVVAFWPDKRSFVSPEHPYLVAIDGVPLERWLQAAGRYVAQGTEQLTRYRSLKALRRVDELRAELGIDPSESVRLTLASEEERRHAVRELRLGIREVEPATLPLAGSRKLAGNIGYLRIPDMDERLIPQLVAAMDQFRETCGLIIDVRYNTGGSQAILRTLYGYFMPADAKPAVINIVAYRLSKNFRPDHLHYRHTFRAEHLDWSDTERKAIKQALDAFEPEWSLPAGEFSGWHFMVLGKSGNPGQYHYREPVVVLCNAQCMSATDNFLSAFADLPGVTLMGESSSGTSGAPRPFRLSESGMTVAVSSAVPFQANGRLFEGNGIEADIRVMPEPGDFLGKSDKVLEEAIRLITECRKDSRRSLL